mgnify:CR=1 FL=1
MVFNYAVNIRTNPYASKLSCMYLYFLAIKLGIDVCFLYSYRLLPKSAMTDWPNAINYILHHYILIWAVVFVVASW